MTEDTYRRYRREIEILKTEMHYAVDREWFRTITLLTQEAYDLRRNRIESNGRR